MNSHSFVQQWAALRTALQFLTRLPVGKGFIPSETAKVESLLWYPFVGLVVGLLLVGISWLFAPLPALLLAAVLVSVWAALSGGLHLDGLADCADAWIAGIGSRSRTLEVMKDPRSGPMAITVLVLFLLLKVTALSTLVTTNGMLVLLSPVIARLMILPAFLWVPYVREKGLGSTIANALDDRLSPNKVRTVFLVILMVTVFMLPLKLWLLLLIAVACLFFYWRYQMMTRLQGFTGDGVGALVELTELCVLLAAVCYQSFV